MKYFYLPIIIFCFAACRSDNKLSSSNIIPEKNAAAKQPVRNSSTRTWIYSEETDQKIPGKKYSADIVANELLQFDFPEDGGSTVTLSIDKTSTITRALLNISKGQFSAGIEGSIVNIGFDNAQPLAFKASSVTNGGEAIISIDDVKSLIQSLKFAKKMTIRADFYDSGSREMTFDVAGFKWE
ncbi:hypothetical protein AAFN85_17595 [Mucilaginibacter sp. CAU 1740]|uniref:hypothetical protein n=1 Tax=Mucilaginibacter sp. CAU 1740 TaxID=3140365 RepID=UPI00325C268D